MSPTNLRFTAEFARGTASERTESTAVELASVGAAEFEEVMESTETAEMAGSELDTECSEEFVAGTVVGYEWTAVTSSSE